MFEKGNSTAKVLFKFFVGHMDTSPDHLTPCSCMCVRGNNFKLVELRFLEGMGHTGQETANDKAFLAFQEEALDMAIPY